MNKLNPHPVYSVWISKSEDLNLVDNEIPVIPLADRIRKHTKPRMRNELVRSICAPLFIKISDCEELVHTLNAEMVKSLRNIENAKVDLLMLNTYVTELPNGQEVGSYLAINMKTTNHTVSLVKFNPSLKLPIVDEMTYGMPKRFLNCSLEEVCSIIIDILKLFEYIGGTIRDFLESRGFENKPIFGSLSVPFAIKKKSIKNGIILNCEGDLKIRRATNADILETLQEVLNRMNVKVELQIVLNDTVSVLASNTIGEVDCAASMIIDSGMNACYLEQTSNIRRDEYFEPDLKYIVINAELAGFGNGGCLKRFITEFDKRLDRLSTAPGTRIFEKFVSGKYISELVRQILNYLTEKNQIFNGNWPITLKEPNSFHARHMCDISRDPPHLFYSTEYILREDLKIPNLKADDLEIVRYVVDAVTFRSACFAGSAAACLLRRLQRLRVTIGVDGCMFRLHPTYARNMLKVMVHLIPRNYTFRLKLSDDSDGKGGAAILAGKQRGKTM